MQGMGYPKLSLRICAAAVFLCLSSVVVQGQEVRSAASSNPSAPEAPAEIRALSDLVRGLQAQVQTLNSQLGDLRMEQERANTEARELRRELDLVKAQGAPAAGGPLNPYSAPPAKEIVTQPASTSSVAHAATADFRGSHRQIGRRPAGHGRQDQRPVPDQGRKRIEVPVAAFRHRPR